MLSFPDWTFFFQIALFLFLWTFLRRFLFEPNFSILQSREQRSAGALHEASQVKADAEAIEERYKSQLTEARIGATQQIDTVFREAETQAQNLISSARSEAENSVAQMREVLAKEILDARRSLEERAPEYSRDIAQKLLGRSLT